MTTTPPSGVYPNQGDDKTPKRGTIYLAGPMRGLPEFNFPAFMAADKHLRAIGWDVRNPAVKDTEDGLDVNGTHGQDHELEQQGFDMREAITWDLNAITWECDAIALLPGWKGSSGSKAELALARFLNIDVYEYDRSSSNGLRALQRVVTLDV